MGLDDALSKVRGGGPSREQSQVWLGAGEEEEAQMVPYLGQVSEWVERLLSGAWCWGGQGEEM